MAKRFALLTLALLVATATYAQEILRAQLLKTAFYSQTSANVPGPASTPYQFEATAKPVLRSLVVGNPALRSPANADYPMPYNSAAEVFRFAQTAATPAGLAPFGSGDYQLTFNGQIGGEQNVTLTFEDGTFPPAPTVANFAAAQDLNSTADFTLRWSDPGDLSPPDRIELRIVNANNEVMFETPAYTETDSLDGSTVAYDLPADILEPGHAYQATLTFYRFAGINDLLLPFWTAAYSSRTTFSLKTKGGGSGPDLTPPVLTEVSPQNGHVFTQTNLFNFPVVFRFDEAMAAAVAIAWSTNVDPAKVSYLWSPDGGTLVCTYTNGWPASAMISWTLNPTAGNAGNFRNTTGLELAANTYKGSFTTGPGDNPVGPCDDNGVPFSILKTISYVQDTNGTVAIDLTRHATFSATLVRSGTPGTNTTIEAVGSGQAETLTGVTLNGITRRTFTAEAATLSELDAQFPSGDYLLKDEGTTTASVTVKLVEGAYPAIPHFLNLPASNAAAFDNDFTIQWEPFAGSGVIALELTKADGTVVFRAPDACVPRTLPPASTSVVVPKGTIAAGAQYWVRLTFISLTDQKAFPGASGLGVAGLARSTAVPLTTPAPLALPANHLKYLGKRVTGTQSRLEFVGAPGQRYLLEGTTDLGEPVDWVRLGEGEAGTNAIVSLNPDADDFPQRFYRLTLVPTTEPLVNTNGPVTVDSERRVSAIANDGLALRFTAQNGDIYHLGLAEDSVLFKEQVTLTQVIKLAGLPFAAGLLAAADVSRWDVEFLDAAEFKVQLIQDPPARLVAFGFNPQSREYFLIPHQTGGREISASISHGGVVGFAVATAAEVDALAQFTPTTFADQLAHASAVARFRATVTPGSGSTARMSLARTATPGPDYAAIYANTIRPALHNAINVHDAYTGLSPYRHWWFAAVAAGKAASLAAEIQEGNTLAVALIQSEATFLEPFVLAHDHDAILKLQMLRSYIAKDPWQNTFTTEEKQALYDRIHNLLRAEFEFDTTLHTDFPDLGAVHVRVQSSTVFYFAGDPRERGKFKGVSPLNFVERNHYPMEPPCVVKVGPPSSATMDLVNSWFHGHGVGTGTGLNRRWLITDMSIGAFPNPTLEDFVIDCPTASFPVTYWWPKFAKFHEDELRHHKLADGLERLVFDFEKSWYVRPSGNAVLATRRHDRTLNIDGVILHEITFMRITHKPL